MRPTDVGNPDYYHRVVDCQWACPAHTNVPEYIRLIAQGRFTDAYLLNRESNVFPGILGRTCDRPCEPACRRGRVDGKPVAICRLKRVAADHRSEVKHLLPTAPLQKNGKKIALIGAGPASLTVANDLMPLGYECTLFEKGPRPGGLMPAVGEASSIQRSIVQSKNLRRYASTRLARYGVAARARCSVSGSQNHSSSVANTETIAATPIGAV